MDVVPASFRAMPRWWSDAAGRAWLDRLPDLVREQCARWGLEPDGPARHGSNALVVPVARGSEPLVLRLAPPGDDVAAEAAALRFWEGRGTVGMRDVDEPRRALLLERLDPTRTLASVPLGPALDVLADIVRTLAVEAPADVPGTDAIARAHAAEFEREWENAGRPVPRAVLEAAVAAAHAVGDRIPPPTAVNADLHSDQVLAGGSSAWTVVDPVLRRGDPEYDLARMLWSRLEEVPDDATLRRCVEVFAARVGVREERARAWVVVRSMSYLLWGLAHGLTEDPPRCRRLLAAFA